MKLLTKVAFAAVYTAVLGAAVALVIGLGLGPWWSVGVIAGAGGVGAVLGSVVQGWFAGRPAGRFEVVVEPWESCWMWSSDRHYRLMLLSVSSEWETWDLICGPAGWSLYGPAGTAGVWVAPELPEARRVASSHIARHMRAQSTEVR